MLSADNQTAFINTGTAAAPVCWRLCDLTGTRTAADTGNHTESTGSKAAGVPQSKAPTANTATAALATATTAQTLLALHGFTGSAADFRWLAEATAAPVSGSLHCYGLDFLGHGGSDAPASPLPYCAGNTVRAIAAAVRALSKQDADSAASRHNAQSSASQTDRRPILLGYSMGGRMALRYLAQHGTTGIRALVLVGASAGLPLAAERRARRTADHALANSIERDGLDAFMAHWNRVPLIASQQRSPYFAQLQQNRTTNHTHGLANSLRGIGTGAVAPVHNRLERIDIPCLLITGAEDEKFTTLATQLARALPQARHVTIAGAGHSPHWESPQAFTNALLAWTAQLR